MTNIKTNFTALQMSCDPLHMCLCLSSCLLPVELQVFFSALLQCLWFFSCSWNENTVSFLPLFVLVVLFLCELNWFWCLHYLFFCLCTWSPVPSAYVVVISLVWFFLFMCLKTFILPHLTTDCLSTCFFFVFCHFLNFWLPQRFSAFYT